MEAAQIKDCYSESPLTLIEAPLANGIYVGGFIGYLNNEMTDHKSIIQYCYAKAPLNVNGYTSVTGGLIGYIAGEGNITVRESYATGNITSANTGASYTGGLVGSLGSGEALISECWASGSVYARGSPGKSSVIYAGGLVGRMGRMIGAAGLAGLTIKNSYALGDVAADDPYSSGGNVYAGGLVGYMDSTAGVYYSFAKGSVTAQTASNSRVCAGGLVGYRDKGDIQHCAVRGETVTAKGPGANRAAARIFGYPTSSFSTDGSSSDNYALNVMYLEIHKVYRNPASTDITVVSAGSAAAGPHGANAEAGELNGAAFWGTTMGFNNSSPGSPAGTWSMSGVGRGYPKLAWQ
jgi:hypothetical protein